MITAMAAAQHWHASMYHPPPACCMHCIDGLLCPALCLLLPCLCLLQGWLNIDFAREVRLERKLGEGGFGQVIIVRCQ
jgi:hypothetical protein